MHVHKEVGEALVTHVDEVVAERPSPWVAVTSRSSYSQVLACLHKACSVRELEAAAAMERYVCVIE